MSRVNLEQITKVYGNHTVVDHIDLEVEDGSLVSILGPSGCGKTTTLRMIAGFEKPDAGRILFDGEPVDSVHVNKRNIGMVFQSYALFPHMTVSKNVAYGLEQHDVPKSEIPERVRDVLERVHMQQYADRKPGQLSGGQQQRVALARALVIRPKVMLLDECLSALDKKLRVEMQSELRKLLEDSKVTAFFVTHDQEEAMTLSDKIVVMNNGTIEQTGSPREVYERPRNSFVADFLGKATFFEGKLDSCGNGTVTINTGDKLLTVPGNTTAAKGSEVLFAIRPENVKLVSGAHQDAPENAIRGNIISTVYSGNMISCTVDCGGVKVKTESTGGFIQSEPKRGDEVYLIWDTEALIQLEI